MNQIEEELYKIHAEAREAAGDKNSHQSETGTEASGSQDADVRSRLQPIGTVTSVDQGSPAESAVSI